MKTYAGCISCGHDECDVLPSIIQNDGMMIRCVKCNMPWREVDYCSDCGHKLDDCTCRDPYQEAEDRYRKFCDASSRIWRLLGTEDGTYILKLGISVDGVELPIEFVGYIAAAIQEKWTYLLSDAERIARRALGAAREERSRENG